MKMRHQWELTLFADVSSENTTVEENLSICVKFRTDYKEFTPVIVLH